MLVNRPPVSMGECGSSGSLSHFVNKLSNVYYLKIMMEMNKDNDDIVSKQNVRNNDTSQYRQFYVSTLGCKCFIIISINSKK